MHACMRMFKACGLAGYYGADYFRSNDNIICWWIYSISWSVPESDVRLLMKWDEWTGHRVTVALWTRLFLDALLMGFTNDCVMLIIDSFSAGAGVGWVLITTIHEELPVSTCGFRTLILEIFDNYIFLKGEGIAGCRIFDPANKKESTAMNCIE